MQSEHADELGDLIVAQVYRFRHEAELARGMLEADGIEAVIVADDCGGQRPLLGASAGVRLLIRRSDAQKVRKLLE